MNQEILRKIISEFGSINVQVPLKLPARLNALIQKKSPNGRAEYIRNLIYKDCMPEILMSRLEANALGWISKEDHNKPIVFDGSEQIRKLKEIIELAEFTILQTIELQKNIQSAQDEYLKKIQERIKNAGG